MKGSTIVVGVIALVLGLVIGVYVIEPTHTGTVTSSDESGGGDATQEATTDKPIRWKMASSFSGELVQLGDQGKMIEKRIGEISDGNMEFKFFEPGALVPALEIFDAVSTGSINAGWTASGYWAGKVPAMPFFTSVPFGPRAGEFLAWLFYGGGVELWTEIYEAHNIHSLPCNIVTPEGSGWFRKEINTLDDFVGLKMRFFGLGAKVMEKLGVSTQLLAGGDIYPALELGAIDATEFSSPAIDYELGFYQVAKHYYFPGWHQPTSFGELMINLDDWKGLSPHQQDVVETACKESLLRGFAQGEAIQSEALQKLTAKGVMLHTWPPEILDALRQAWAEVVEEESANDADFARVWTSLKTFRENYKIWYDLGYFDE